ncbi:uncharacterized protein IL334_001903 [Kwoniella shivajii]|uniref:Copper transport protein n=1 Tax=Kwoniella shivajii TaxID=564305 RepID=A0ABZ1CXE6_9TREE|nr:hypothetical protein IL334_001903 [Kwoniella shivajii]
MDHMSSSTNSTCQMSDMLWNWDVMNTCFLSSGWHITTRGAFAASCIGIIFIAILLELLRRVSRDYDRWILRQLSTVTMKNYRPRRATPLQQLIRSLLHVAVFGVAYLLMLLAMSYNGYIIFSILMGTGIGKFFCDWLVLGVEATTNDQDPTVCCG